MQQNQLGLLIQQTKNNNPYGGRMLKKMVVLGVLMMAVSAQAGLVTGVWDAVKSQKAVGLTQASHEVQGAKSVNKNSQQDVTAVLDLNEGF